MTRIAELFDGRPTSSFEFFPPKTDAGWLSLGRTIADLEPLAPSFVSVTYGAGGSTRTRTHELVGWMRRETTLTPMAHLTCVNHSRGEITEILDRYRDDGVHNILALAGDPPAGEPVTHSDYRHAVDLVEQISATGAFSVGVAAHPDGHPRSADLAADRRFLAHKLAVADFAITQFFFDVDRYQRLVDDLAALGVDKPVVPGIMPVTNLAQVQRMAAMSGTEVPSWLVHRLTEAGGHDSDAEAMRAAGIEAATELCAGLLDAGAPGLHFYTLNRSSATRQIATNIGITGAEAAPSTHR